MGFFQILSQWAADNPGKTVGGILGFVLGVLLFTIGFVKTMLILLLVLIGIFLGKSRDDGNSIIDQVTRLFKRD